MLPEIFDGGLSSHVFMQRHVCVFDMCWAHRRAMWLKPLQRSRNSRRQTSPCRLLLLLQASNPLSNQQSVGAHLMRKDVIAPCSNELTVPASLSSVGDSPAQRWRDLSHSSRRQGVEVGHVLSRVMPQHSYTNNNGKHVLGSTGCRCIDN